MQVSNFIMVDGLFHCPHSLIPLHTCAGQVASEDKVVAMQRGSACEQRTPTGIPVIILFRFFVSHIMLSLKILNPPIYGKVGSAPSVERAESRANDNDETQPYDILSAEPHFPAVVVGASPKVILSAEKQRQQWQQRSGAAPPEGEASKAPRTPTASPAALNMELDEPEEAHGDGNLSCVMKMLKHEPTAMVIRYI